MFKKNRVVCRTRCHTCGVRLLFSDLEDPDEVIEAHLKKCAVALEQNK